ncbi:hypothetical protein SASPL_152436 [Salvia splendens]|uniref:Uncharacterized protein n=1 Tax=Salvia splendens TaxID=180675 RepID=A0A8X8W3L0_SALSN|nr:hypothetical protein SASPL_152436 [Salvia splendens]
MKGYNLCRLNLRMNVFHLRPATSSDHSRIFITAPTPRSHKELPLEEISAARILCHHVGPAGFRSKQGKLKQPRRRKSDSDESSSGCMIWMGIRSRFAGIRHQFDDSFLNLSGFAAIRRRFDDSFLSRSGSVTGRKGKLGIAADIFSVAPSVVVVEVKKSSGDTLEYNQFCSKELRPALKDIVWTGNFVPA